MVPAATGAKGRSSFPNWRPEHGDGLIAGASRGPGSVRCNVLGLTLNVYDSPMRGLRRQVRFHQAVAMSGGQSGLAIAGAVTVAVGGCASGLLVALAGISWLLAPLAAVACMFVFYALGAYRVWNKADSERTDALENLAAERAKPSGPTFVSAKDSDHIYVHGNTMNIAGWPPVHEPPT